MLTLGSLLSSVTFLDVIVFQNYFNTILGEYTEIKYQLNNLFHMNIKFDENNNAN